MDTNVRKLNRQPNHEPQPTTPHHHKAVAFPPVTSTPIQKIEDYIFCHQLKDISTMEEGNLCNLVNCSGTEPHTQIFTERPSYQINPYDGS